MSTPPSKGRRIAGHVLSSLVALVLVGSSVGKLLHAAPIVENFKHFEVSESLVTVIGIIELGCAVLSIVPWTRFFGVILITGYMGGAVLTHLRIGEPVIAQVLIGVVAWTGLALRDPRVLEAAFRSPPKG